MLFQWSGPCCLGLHGSEPGELDAGAYDVATE